MAHRDDAGKRGDDRSVRDAGLDQVKRGRGLLDTGPLGRDSLLARSLLDQRNLFPRAVAFCCGDRQSGACLVERLLAQCAPIDESASSLHVPRRIHDLLVRGPKHRPRLFDLLLPAPGLELGQSGTGRGQRRDGRLSPRVQLVEVEHRDRVASLYLLTLTNRDGGDPPRVLEPQDGFGGLHRA